MNHDYFNWSSRDWEQSLDWIIILRLYTRNTDIWRILKTKTNIKIDTKWLLEFVRKLRIMEILSFSFSHHLQRTLIIYNSTNQATFPYINFCIHLARINPINSRIYERSELKHVTTIDIRKFKIDQVLQPFERWRDVYRFFNVVIPNVKNPAGQKCILELPNKAKEKISTW